MPDYSALKAEFALPEYVGMTDAQALAQAQAQAKYPPPAVPVKFTPTQVIGCFAAGGGNVQTTVQTLRALPGFLAFQTAVLSQDTTALGGLIGVALTAGDITQAQHDALAALFAATQPDPAGQVTLPGWGIPMTTNDVAHARSL